MKKYLLYLSIISLFACSDETNQESKTIESNSLEEKLDAYFDALNQLKKFNGLVVAYKSDSLVLAKAYNFYPYPENSTYVSLESQFDIHSVSKLMTEYLLVQLEEKQRLSRTQKLSEFYPDFPKGDSISLEMLLNHSSGLPRELMNLEGDEFDLESDQIIELAKQQSFLFEPGTDIQYSNVGYEILYNIISKYYQKPFAKAVLDEVFIPLEMKHSGAHFYTTEQGIVNLVQNHILKDSILEVVPNILPDEFKTARFYSTASDLILFLEALEKQPYYDKIKDENGIIAKDGGSKGIRAQVYTDVPNQFRFVILANYDEMPFFKTVEDVSKILKQEKVDLPKAVNRKAIELDSLTLAKYVGTYAFADFDGLLLEVAIENNQLVVFQGNEKIAELKAESETVFFENPKAEESFEFIKNDSGSYHVMMGWKGIEVEGKRK